MQKLKVIAQLLFKGLLALLLFVGSYMYLNRVFYNKEVDRGLSFHALRENSLDVLVLGSSHAQYSFVPTFFYEQTGLTSYVLGSACQPLEVSYEMLKEAYKTQNPKVVYLEVYTSMPLRKICESDSCYVIAEYQMRGEEKYNTINYLDAEKAKTYYNDFLTYHSSWKTMTDFSDFLPEKVMTMDQGSVSQTLGYIPQNPGDYTNTWYTEYHDVEAKPLEDRDLWALNQILDYCREKGAELILYKTPIDNLDAENQAVLNSVWQWAEQHQIRYYDFNAMSEKIDFQMCALSDSYHAYINGAGLLTSLLANDIDLKPRTFDASLDDLYRAASPSLTINYLRYEYNPYRVIKRLGYTDATLYIQTQSAVTSTDLEEALNELCGREVDWSVPHKLLVEKGHIVSEDLEFNKKINGVRIQNTDGNIVLNDETKSISPLNIVYISKTGDYYNYEVNSLRYPWKKGFWDYLPDTSMDK